jgi:Mg2+-importing ATPase
MSLSARRSAFPDLAAAATAPADVLLRDLDSSRDGLSEDEAARRLRRFGPNRVAQESGGGVLRELARHVFNPLNGLLLALAAASFAMSDQRSAIVISAIVVLSVLLAFVQEHRANTAAAELRAMVRTHASVRRPVAGDDPFVEISLEEMFG